MPAKGKITSTISGFGKNTFEMVKKEASDLQEELEKQLGVSPAATKDAQEEKEQSAIQEGKGQKKRKKERESLRDLEKQLATARQQIEEERKKKKEIRDSQLVAENEKHKPVVQGLSAGNMATENALPDLDQTPLPSSRPRRGFFRLGVEKFKKKE